MRLIDADALHFDKIWKKYGRLVDSVVACEILVEEAPTVDAVKVVRCEDCMYGVCQYYIDISGNMFDGFCEKWLKGISASDFCSYGERKEDGN